MARAPLTIWAVSDGRIGIENQVLGLAEALARLTPADVVVKRIRYRPAFDWLPASLKVVPDAMLTRDSDRVTAPWPDVWIGAGRATLPHSLRVKRQSQGRTLVVQLQDPTVPAGGFDLVIAPEHDAVLGSNVLSLLGSTHRVTAQRLQAEASSFAPRLVGLKPPFVTVLIGGRSKTHDLGPDRARAMAADIRRAVTTSGGSLLMTFSRRTPAAAKDILLEALSDLPGVIDEGKGDNPYFAFVGAADYILVTEDSVNMAAEAATSGKPVYRIAMDRRRPAGKFDTFHKALESRGIARAFDGELEAWTYPPLSETDRAARAVMDRLAVKA